MDRQINHKTMRVIVGVIAILLAPIVLLLADNGSDLNSISASYWTNSGDIFVGCLIAVGFFLSAYNGTGGEKDWEFYLSKAACAFAIGVALFPTDIYGDDDIAPTWTTNVSGLIGLTPKVIHYGSALLLFGCLIALMWFFSKRARKKGKLKRSNIYRVIAALMTSGIIIFFIVGQILKLENTVLLIEAWGLMWFGLGWLIAGSYKTEPELE